MCSNFSDREAEQVARFGFDKPPLTAIITREDGAAVGIDWENSPLIGGRGTDVFRPFPQSDDIDLTDSVNR